MKSKYIMINFNSNHIEFLIEHKINPKVMKKWNFKQLNKLDNLIKECEIPQHKTLKCMYYWMCYHFSYF